MVNMMGQLPIKVLSLPSRFSFSQPFRQGRVTGQSYANKFLIYISGPPSSQHMQYKTLYFSSLYTSTVLTCDSPPYCHREGHLACKFGAG